MSPQTPQIFTFHTISARGLPLAPPPGRSVLRPRPKRGLNFSYAEAWPRTLPPGAKPGKSPPPGTMQVVQHGSPCRRHTAMQPGSVMAPATPKNNKAFALRFCLSVYSSIAKHGIPCPRSPVLLASPVNTVSRVLLDTGNRVHGMPFSAKRGKPCSAGSGVALQLVGWARTSAYDIGEAIVDR